MNKTEFIRNYKNDTEEFLNEMINRMEMYYLQYINLVHCSKDDIIKINKGINIKTCPVCGANIENNVKILQKIWNEF